MNVNVVANSKNEDTTQHNNGYIECKARGCNEPVIPQGDYPYAFDTCLKCYWKGIKI